MNDISKPQLTESGFKILMSNTLHSCSIIQKKYYNNLFNIILFLIFAIALFLFLKSKYKGKMNIEELKQKQLEKKRYIISCIQKMNSCSNIKLEKENERFNLITKLPRWN